MPLANHAGGVAGFLEQLGHGDFVGMQSFGCAGVQHAAARCAAAGSAADLIAETDTHRVAAGQQARTRRRAGWAGRVKIGESPPFLGHAIEVRRFNLLRAKAAQVAIPQIIREEHDDIRAIVGDDAGYARQRRNQQSNSHRGDILTRRRRVCKEDLTTKNTKGTKKHSRCHSNIFVFSFVFFVSFVVHRFCVFALSRETKSFTKGSPTDRTCRSSRYGLRCRGR